MDTNDRRYEDTALRKALSRISEQEQKEPMPDDFEQQVMSKVSAKPARRWMQAAAVFIGVLLLSGIALAAWQLSKTNDSKTSSTDLQTTTTLQPVEAKDNITRFDNVPLDSVLTVVTVHYNKDVIFRNEHARRLRFLIEWDREAPLSQFIELINNFDGIRITEGNDTIFAE